MYMSAWPQLSYQQIHSVLRSSVHYNHRFHSYFLSILVDCYKKLTWLLCCLPQLKYKEVYQRNKSNCTIKPDAVHIKAAKDAYKVNTNVSSINFP